MITESAVVTRREGRQVELRLERGSVCAGCELNQGCGTGALGRLLGHRSKPIVIETDHDLNPGDSLRLGVPESALVKASLMVYGFPLTGMIIGGLLAVLLNLPEFIVGLSALAGFATGYKFATSLARRLEDDLFEPYIIDIQLNSSSRTES
jgi:sigma-E factor negative regulatory protein RseC